MDYLRSGNTSGNSSPDECRNLTNQQNDSVLNEVNDKYATMMIPYMVYIGVIMVIGIVGNVTVILVYSKKCNKITLNYFVITLAMFDLLTCVVSFPFNILRTKMQFKFPSEVFCKIGFSSLYMTVSAASFILICIAAHRYNKVCRPLKKGFNNKTALRLCYASFPVGLCVSAPTAVIFGFSTRQDRATGICGYECFIQDEYEHTASLLAFVLVLCFIFCALVVIVSVLYTLVGREAYRRRNVRTARRKHHLHNLANSSETLNSAKASACDFRSSVDALDVGDSVVDKKLLNGAETKLSTTNLNSNNNRSTSHTVASFKTERMLLAVTVFFILCWLPFWVFICGTVVYGSFLQPETPSQHIIRKVFYEAFYFNNAANPIIYAFVNSAFRDDFKRLFTR